MNWLARAAAALALAGAIGIGGWHYATHWAPPANTYPLQGIDLPADPGDVEWGTVRAQGADFAYLTATVGRDRAAAFEGHWNALPANGLRRGAVLVYSLCQPALDQANAFNTTVPRAADALPAAIDLDFREDCETRPEGPELIADLKTAIAMVEAHTGKPVLLRIARPVERAYDLTAALDRPIWEMANFLKPDYAARPWRMWRATDIRRIDGLDMPVNWDVVRD